MNGLKLKYFVNEVGLLRSNSYIAYDEDTKKAVIIDAGDDAWKILETIHAHRLNPVAVYATHCHFDHVMAVEDLKQSLGVPFYIHPDDRELLARSRELTRGFLGIDIPEPAEPDGYVVEGQVIELGGCRLKVIHTPGHSPGSVCYYTDGILFSGDTLFQGSIGRTDAFGGDTAKIVDSIVNKLFTLPDDVHVLPGHGLPTTLGWEKRNNPFVGEEGILRRK
ncbi:MAG: MBL fold metallo-hydrolase [Candidatus Caldarchaeum sp.]